MDQVTWTVIVRLNTEGLADSTTGFPDGLEPIQDNDGNIDSNGVE